MRIAVLYLEKEHLVEMRGKATVLELLEKMGVNPEAVLVARRGEIIPETEGLKDKDALELIRVISGG